MNIIKIWLENNGLRKLNIDATKPTRLGITKKKRKREVIISLTTHPARIKSSYKTICCLLNQDYKPDRVILWLAQEQFESIEKVPLKIRDLQKYGLMIAWYHDIRSYKKLIPTLRQFSDALIVTVDDDWYYRRDMLKVLMNEHEKYPNEIICHAITHPRLTEEKKIRASTNETDYRGTASFMHKILSGSGVLFQRDLLDEIILNEKLFMKLAPTNDDIWFWVMAVKKGSKIRLPKEAHGCVLMTDAELQGQNSLGILNSANNF